jgi:DNA-binding SARP family transcriptional activator
MKVMEKQIVYILKLMGAPLLRRGEESVRLGRRKALGLLAYLAFGKRQYNRDTLAALFWPDHDQVHARGSVRRLLSELRRQFGEELIPTEEERVGPLNLKLIHVDIEEFQALLARARAPGREAAPGSGGDVRKLLEQAAGLYRGEFLAGFSLGECGEFSDWQFLQAEYLRRELCAALTSLVEICEAAGESDEAITFARRLVSEDPLNEEAYCALMRLYAGSGRREEALHQYRLCAELLEKELQLEPEEATTELYEAIRHSRPAPSEGAGAVEDALPLSGGKPRLAVLPFTGLAGEQEWLSDGMTDALITELSKHEALEVVSYTSSRRYQNTHKSLRQVAAELGVDHLLEGAVLKAGEAVRVSAQLVEATSDRHVWAESFRGTFAGILELQEHISRETATAVLGRLVPLAPVRAGQGVPAVNPAAREACMLGYYTLRRSESEEGLRKAKSYFQQAIEIDPRFSEAYAGMAFTYFTLGGYGRDVVPSPAVRQELDTLISRALEIDPENVHAHMVLAGCRLEWDWDWAGAEAEFEKVLAIDPNHVETLCWYSCLKMAFCKFEDQFALLQKAQQINPLDLATLVHLHRYYCAVFRYRRSLEILNRVEELYPGRSIISIYRAWVYMLMGHYEHALEIYGSISDPVVLDMYRGFQAYAYGKTVREEKAGELIEQMTADYLKKRGSVLAYDIGLALHGLEQDDKALDWLEKAFRDRDNYLMQLAHRTLWGELHFDSRFQDILRCMGLSPQLDYIRTALERMKQE